MCQFCIELKEKRFKEVALLVDSVLDGDEKMVGPNAKYSGLVVELRNAREALDEATVRYGQTQKSLQELGSLLEGAETPDLLSRFISLTGRSDHDQKALDECTASYTKLYQQTVDKIAVDMGLVFADRFRAKAYIREELDLAYYDIESERATMEFLEQSGFDTPKDWRKSLDAKKAKLDVVKVACV